MSRDKPIPIRYAGTHSSFASRKRSPDQSLAPDRRQNESTTSLSSLLRDLFPNKILWKRSIDRFIWQFDVPKFMRSMLWELVLVFYIIFFYHGCTIEHTLSLDSWFPCRVNCASTYAHLRARSLILIEEADGIMTINIRVHPYLDFETYLGTGQVLSMLQEYWHIFTFVHMENRTIFFEISVHLANKIL